MSFWEKKRLHTRMGEFKNFIGSKIYKRLFIQYLCLKEYEMKLTINIKEQSKIAAFLNLIKEIDYIEIVNVKEELHEFPTEHEDLLDKRLQKIEKGEATFKNWDLIKKKYEV